MGDFSSADTTKPKRVSRCASHGKENSRVGETQLSVLPGGVVGQHIGLDHECDVCALVTKFACRLSQLLGNPHVDRLTRVMAGTPKALLFASLSGESDERRKSEGEGDIRRLRVLRGI